MSEVCVGFFLTVHSKYVHIAWGVVHHVSFCVDLDPTLNENEKSNHMSTCVHT